MMIDIADVSKVCNKITGVLATPSLDDESKSCRDIISGL